MVSRSPRRTMTWTCKAMTTIAARELDDGDDVNVGVPTLVTTHLRQALQIALPSENRILAPRPVPHGGEEDPGPIIGKLVEGMGGL